MKREEVREAIETLKRHFATFEGAKYDEAMDSLQVLHRLALRATNPDWIPTSWLDSLLTGPRAVIGKPPYDCKDIERLLLAIRERAQEPHDE